MLRLSALPCLLQYKQFYSGSPKGYVRGLQVNVGAMWAPSDAGKLL